MRPSLVTRFIIKVLLIATFSVATQAAERPGIHAIFKTIDRGRSWFRSDEGMPGNFRINAFGSLDESILAGTDSGIYISRDEGQSWQPSTGTATTPVRITSFASLGQNLYAGTDRHGILVSSDKGLTWSLNSSFPSKKVRCLLGHQGKLHAGTDAEGVLVSNDGGQSWIRLDQGLPVHAQIFAMSAVEGRLFAGLYSKGLYAWNDQEHQWTKAGRVSPLVLAPIGDTLVAGHNPGGIYWSDDCGATWSQGTVNSLGKLAPVLSDHRGELAGDAPVWELASNDDIIFAGASAGIYYSEDRGRTWSRARIGLPAESPGVSFLLKGNLVLAATLIKEANGEPGGAANGSQPIRLETNRTSSAAGSRR
jgi:photosystem II stability/assembly factor-like uncharacterized protein